MVLLPKTFVVLFFPGPRSFLIFILHPPFSLQLSAVDVDDGCNRAKHAVSERASWAILPCFLSLKCGGPLLRLLDARAMYERDCEGVGYYVKKICFWKFEFSRLSPCLCGFKVTPGLTFLPQMAPPDLFFPSFLLLENDRIPTYAPLHFSPSSSIRDWQDRKPCIILKG